jgi:2-iminobutanoate/2-iminopropanoate deaminase
MKTTFSMPLICFVFAINSCQKLPKQEVYFHKSHEESRKNAPFSEATQVGNLYFLTGQIGKNHQTGKMVEGGIEAETAQVIKNIEAVLKNHNMTLKEVVKCTVILADIDDFSKMNAVYTTFFVDNLPARTTFAANLVAGAKIEIEVIAAKK